MKFQILSLALAASLLTSVSFASKTSTKNLRMVDESVTPSAVALSGSGRGTGRGIGNGTGRGIGNGTGRGIGNGRGRVMGFVQTRN